jgi:hypothetical protein
MTSDPEQPLGLNGAPETSAVLALWLSDRRTDGGSRGPSTLMGIHGALFPRKKRLAPGAVPRILGGTGQVAQQGSVGRA